jgi:hypothetical protein
MKQWFATLVFLSFFFPVISQDRDQKLIIVTTDGFRWQEVFTGMDSAIANDKIFNQGDSADLFNRYWDPNVVSRRQKLMPFFWGTLVSGGQLYGNRKYNNNVNNANPYWFSYPGYSEILTGNVDTLINSNDYPPNPHTSILEFYNKLPNYKGRVAAFGAWDAFDRILNEKRAGFPVINAFDDNSIALMDTKMTLLNTLVQNSYRPFGNAECLDVFTHYQAFHYLEVKKPKVLYISYGETDEFAHGGDYKFYLDAAHQFDKWVGELWDWVQHQPDYKDKTTLLITTDHGRGDIIKKEWTSHGSDIQDASQIWFGIIGPKVKAMGEMKTSQQIYQEQLAQTAAMLTGQKFTCEHRVADAVEILKK